MANAPEPKTKRFHLSEQEVKDMKQLQRIFDDLFLTQQGIKRQMDYLMVEVQVRCNVAEEEAPEGFTRRRRLDPKTYELVIEDYPVAPEILTK